MIDDLASLSAELLTLVKAMEFEKARELVQRARRASVVADFEGRQQTVHALTLTIAAAKRQRARLLQEVDLFPSDKRAFAQAELERLCRCHFDEVIAALTTEKRKLSQPRQS